MIEVYDKHAPVRVESVSLRGPGVLILTGPSSCGKGEIAAALCALMSIDRGRHLSMGEILRTAYQNGRSDLAYAKLLEEKYFLSADENIFDCIDSSEDLSAKVKRYLPDLKIMFRGRPGREVTDVFVSQLDWLEFCTTRGLLVPNRWTQDLIAAGIEHAQAESSVPFILDGYPRTVAAAKHLLTFLRSLDVPVIKVLHMSISKTEMLLRAERRGRLDDDGEALRSRFEFYIENVQPSVDYMKQELGADRIALIDAHQPAFDEVDGERVFNLRQSISNVVAASLRSLGVPRVIIRDLLDSWRSGETDLPGVAGAPFPEPPESGSDAPGTGSASGGENGSE